MKKEEFPTFLNEQPTVVFGRTTRELLIIAIGLSSGYLLWQDIIGSGHASAALNAIGIACGIFPVMLSAVVAFVKIATRPLEEWAVILFSYLVLPKIYLYMSLEEEEDTGKGAIEGMDMLNAVPFGEDDDDRYN